MFFPARSVTYNFIARIHVAAKVKHHKKAQDRAKEQEGRSRTSTKLQPTSREMTPAPLLYDPWSSSSWCY